MTKRLKWDERRRNYCKYCYSTYTDWSEDGNHEYGVLTCGKCNHATKFATEEEIDEYNRTWLI
jgi:RNase P subunit RPR2